MRKSLPDDRQARNPPAGGADGTQMDAEDTRGKMRTRPACRQAGAGDTRINESGFGPKKFCISTSVCSGTPSDCKQPEILYRYVWIRYFTNTEEGRHE